MAIPLAYAPSIVSGGIRAISSYSKLKGLEKQALPKFDTTQAQKNIDMYQRRFRQGLSPEERSQMSQQFQTEQAGMYRQTSERAGGQISNFLGRVSALDRVRNAMQTGSMMAQERRAAMSGLAGARQGLQNQLNAQTRTDLSRRMAEERALGEGMKAGLNSLERGLAYGLKAGSDSNSTDGTDDTSSENGGSSRPLFSLFGGGSSRPLFSLPGSGSGPTKSIDPLDALYGVRSGNLAQSPGTYTPTGLDALYMDAGRDMSGVQFEDFSE